MARKFEGLFIFPERLGEDELDSAVEKSAKVIEDSGSTVSKKVRIGKRRFARLLKKKKNGHYVVIEFEAEPDKIEGLRTKFKRMDEVFRVQFTRANADAVKTEV